MANALTTVADVKIAIREACRQYADGFLEYFSGSFANRGRHGEGLMFPVLKETPGCWGNPYETYMNLQQGLSATLIRTGANGGAIVGDDKTPVVLVESLRNLTTRFRKAYGLTSAGKELVAEIFSDLIEEAKANARAVLQGESKAVPTTLEPLEAGKKHYTAADLDQGLTGGFIYEADLARGK